MLGILSSPGPVWLVFVASFVRLFDKIYSQWLIVREIVGGEIISSSSQFQYVGRNSLRDLTAHIIAIAKGRKRKCKHD